MQFFTLLGVAAFIYVLGSVARIIYDTFVYKADLSVFQTPTRDAWAVVTGATSGIGEGFAHVLAARGWNVLLVSRSNDKLQAVAADIAKRSPKSKVKTVVSDAAAPDVAAQVAQVLEAVKALPSNSFRMLVSNVGVSNDPGLFATNKPEDIGNMIDVNCRYSTQLSVALIPLLRQATGGKVGSGNSASRQRAAIINLASQAAFIHVPMLAVYSATKAFNLAFSHALRDELAEDGVEVLALTPGFVCSAMSKMSKPNLQACSAETCANAGLNALGLRDHCGYWFHHVILAVTMAVPASLRSMAVLSTMKSLLKKQAAKKQRAAEKASAGSEKKE